MSSWLGLGPHRHWAVPLWLGLCPCDLVGYALVAWAAPSQTPDCALVAVHGRLLGLQSCFLADSGCTLVAWAAPSWLILHPCRCRSAPSWLGLRPCGLGCALVAWWAMLLWLGLRPRRHWAVISWLGLRLVGYTLVAWAAPLQMPGCALWGCVWQITWAAELLPCRLWLCPRGFGCTLTDAGLHPHGLGYARQNAWAAELRPCRLWLHPCCFGCAWQTQVLRCHRLWLCPCGFGCALVAWAAPS
jgi:hypothetical protein